MPRASSGSGTNSITDVADASTRNLVEASAGSARAGVGSDRSRRNADAAFLREAQTARAGFDQALARFGLTWEVFL